MSYAAQITALSDAIIEERSGDMLPHIRPARAEAMTPKMRLAIYTEGYSERLLNAVRADYPELATYLGGHALEESIHAYIRATPSLYWDLNRYGAGFADFFATRTHDPKAAALARLEGAVVEVFWLPDSEALAAATLAGLAPEELAARHFTPRTALRLVQHDGECTCIVRHEHRVRRMSLDAAEHALLTLLFAGAPFGEALEQARCPSLADALPRYLARWLEHGFFVA